MKNKWLLIIGIILIAITAIADGIIWDFLNFSNMGALEIVIVVIEALTLLCGIALIIIRAIINKKSKQKIQNSLNNM